MLLLCLQNADLPFAAVANFFFVKIRNASVCEIKTISLNAVERFIGIASQALDASDERKLCTFLREFGDLSDIRRVIDAEKLICGDAQHLRDGGEQRHVGKSHAVFPFADRLRRDAEPCGERLLGEPQLLAFLYDNRCEIFHIFHSFRVLSSA